MYPASFLRLAIRYHKRFGQSRYDSMLDVRKRFNFSALAFDQTRWLFDTYLLDWGKMHRVYPKVYRKRIVSRLHAYLPTLVRTHPLLNGLALTSDQFLDARQPITSIYDELSNVGIKRPKRSIRIGPTAAAKLLHFTYPDLFVIWDRRWVREPQGYGETSDEYYRYLSDKRGVLERIIAESGKADREAVEWLILRHSIDLAKLGFPPTLEPITKILDEINFGVKDPSD